VTRRGSLRRLRWPVTAAAFTAAAFVLLGASPAAAAPANAVSGGTSTLVETLTGGALLLCAIAGLIVVLRLRSRRGSGNRRTPTHTGAAAPSGDRSGGSSAPGTSGARTDPGADGPGPSRDRDRSSRAASAEEPDWPYPDHPSWPAGRTGRPLTPDHPSWPANGLGRPIGYGSPRGAATNFRYSDHPSWPASDPGRRVASDDRPGRPAAGPGGPGAVSARPADEGPGRQQREPAGESPSPAMHHGQYPRPPAPHVPPARGRHVRVPAGYSGYPRPGVPTGETPQRGSAQLARNPGLIPQTYYDLAPGDGRPQVVLTEMPGGDPGQAAGARSGQMVSLPGPGASGGRVSWDTEGYGNPGPVRVAERVLADADQQAAAIRQEAASEAVAIR
jgi:hypothetical protein